MVPPFGGNTGIYITISHRVLATVALCNTKLHL